MNKVGHFGRLKHHIKWLLFIRHSLPSEVYIEAAPNIRLKVKSFATGNIVSWSKRVYGMQQNLLKYEIPETRIFLERIKSASVFYDIGAHIGYYSLIAANHSNIKQVIAFEVLETYAKEIQYHAEENGFANITVEITPIGNGQNIEYGNLVAYSAKGKSISIDEYVFNSNLVPDMIKMDIEGYEYQALQGAIETLRGKPDLLLSVHPNFIKNGGGKV